jgi:hypothetical protein
LPKFNTNGKILKRSAYKIIEKKMNIGSNISVVILNKGDFLREYNFDEEIKKERNNYIIFE